MMSACPVAGTGVGPLSGSTLADSTRQLTSSAAPGIRRERRARDTMGGIGRALGEAGAVGAVTQTGWMEVGGWAGRRFEPVREMFAQVLAGQNGTGAAVAAWWDGAWVVDLWGG